MISLGAAFLALFEAPGVISGFENVAMVGDPVEERGGHLGIAEDRDPFGEAEVGRDDEGCLFVELADEMDEGGIAKGPGDRLPADTGCRQRPGMADSPRE